MTFRGEETKALQDHALDLQPEALSDNSRKEQALHSTSQTRELI